MVAVRMLRQLLGCPQAEFARLAGLSSRTLIRIEKGDAIASAETTAQIDKAFYALILGRLKEGV